MKLRGQRMLEDKLTKEEQSSRRRETKRSNRRRNVERKQMINIGQGVRQ